MAHQEQESFLTMEKAWDSDEYLPTKQKFGKTISTGRTIKGEVTPDDGEKTINKDRVDKDRLGRVSGKRSHGDERRDKQYRLNYGRNDDKAYRSSRSAKSSSSRSNYLDSKDRKYRRSSDGNKRSGKSYNRQDKTRSSDFIRKDKRNCPKHKPCEHTWEECFSNPNREKKGESHYQSEDASSNSDGSDTTSSHDSDSNCEDENHFQHSEEEGEVPMKSMQDKISKKKKAKKGKLAKKRYKGKRKAARRILDDTSDEDDFANSNNE